MPLGLRLRRLPLSGLWPTPAEAATLRFVVPVSRLSTWNETLSPSDVALESSTAQVTSESFR